MNTIDITIFAALKNTGYAVIFLASATYLGITPVSIGIMTGLIIADIVTGVVRAGTVDGWHTVRSGTLERGVIAKCLLILVPIVLSLAGRGIDIDLGFLAQATINVLILSEAYSIIGNIYSIRTGQTSTEFDAVAYVLRSIKGLLKSIITEDTP